ncbi:hypothetical protein HIM_03674 [Hirsutella minnesotensis 3608]|uniref:Delta 8-(E)-sphingolipid desaturase n=1 Tax=Hirsutella minnesotensis 3608 TaxID=1043627 RepID=A0A0F8A274_9HYPO|nr:hypothetical protein HIM_03674 [Hirsutella minnesotensis 3608]
MDRDQVLTPRTVEDMIARGHTIVIYQEYVLRLDSWLLKHPGGSLAILHMVGRDATDEITAYHCADVLRTIKAYRIGRKPPGIWHNYTPPIRGGSFRPLDTILSTVDLESSLRATQIDDDESAESSSDIFDDGASTPLTSCSVGLDISDELAKESISDFEGAVRKRLATTTTHEDQHAGHVAGQGKPALTRDQYTEWAVQQGIDKARREYPSVDPAVQQHIVSKYREMYQKVIDEGLGDCPYREYAKEMTRYTILFVGSLVALRYGWHITSAALLGVFWHQIMFTAHDAGHLSITHIYAVDTLIGIFIADFCCGLSMGWWKSSHNVHHLVTNQPEHDPDIQNVPVFAVCPSFFKSITSTYYDNFVFAWDAAAELLVPYQKYTYYPVMAIARFNLYVLSWIHVLSPKAPSLANSKAWWTRPTEIAFMACYWFLFGYCLLWRSLPTWTARVMYVLVSHIITMPLHIQINLSHWGMSTSDLGESESFAQRQLRTTMDVDCPPWLDFFHGGLQFQAVHHLFPRVPRHNLRRVQVLVKDFCLETGVPYSILSFADSNRKVLGRLQEVSDQLKVLVDCQKSMADSGECKLH